MVVILIMIFGSDFERNLKFWSSYRPNLYILICNLHKPFIPLVIRSGESQLQKLKMFFPSRSCLLLDLYLRTAKRNILSSGYLHCQIWHCAYLSFLLYVSKTVLIPIEYFGSNLSSRN